MVRVWLPRRGERAPTAPSGRLSIYFEGWTVHGIGASAGIGGATEPLGRARVSGRGAPGVAGGAWRGASPAAAALDHGGAVTAGDPVPAVLLAAGVSRRMGSPKLMLKIGGETLLRRSARSALEAGLRPVLVVVPHAVGGLLEELADLEGVVGVPGSRESQGASLEAGLRAVPESSDRAMVLLADMPFLPPTTMRQLLERHECEGCLVAAADHDRIPGPPLVLDRSLFASIGGCSREERRERLLDLGGRVCLVEVGPGTLMDVDTPADYVEALRVERMTERELLHEAPARDDVDGVASPPSVF